MEEKGRGKGQRLVLMPSPHQGHITPLLQLADILYSKGFSITIIHTIFNSLDSSSYRHFTFHPISDGLSKAEASTLDSIHLTDLINIRCAQPLKECLAMLLSQQPITCFIADTPLYFTRAVCNYFKLPRFVLRTGGASSFVVFASFPLLRVRGYLPIQELGGRGYIVKWAPQEQVLSHHAVGAFLTHSGWNSTLESICERVPMICMPCFGDQKVNAKYVSDVWKVGVQLQQNKLERGEIEKTIRKLMVGDEGNEIRENILILKEKANVCLKEGGSSSCFLDCLVSEILLLESSTSRAH